MKLNQLNLEEFTSRVSQKTSTPGGGAVLAYVNELAASLLLMVANFTLGKKDYDKYQKEIESLIPTLEEIKRDCHELIDEDADAFSSLMNAFKSKDNEQIASSSLIAAEVPLRLYTRAKELIIYADFLIDHGNKNLTSDAVIAKALCKSSLKGSYEHVAMNMDAIKEEHKAKYEKFISEEGEYLNDTL